MNAASGDTPARLSLVLPAVLSLVGVLVTWGIIVGQLHVDERRMEVEGAAAAAKAAVSHAAHVDDLIDQGDQLLVAIRHMRRNGSSADQIQRMMDELPHHWWMNPTYADADGVVRSARAAASLGIRVHDQHFFQRHRSDPSADLKIHEAAFGLGAMAGTKVIRLTRRVDRGTAGFDGVASVTMPAHLLTEPRSASATRAGGLIFIGFRDGKLLTGSVGTGAVPGLGTRQTMGSRLTGESSLAEVRSLLQQDDRHFLASAPLLNHPFDVMVESLSKP